SQIFSRAPGARNRVAVCGRRIGATIHTMRRAKGIFGLAVAVAAAGLVGACSGTVNNHGHVMRESALETLQPGISTRQTVTQALGSPSSVAAFDDRTWYYIGQKVENLAFFKPQTKERQVLVLRFDQYGVLDSMEMLSAEDGRQIAFVDRETPTAGHELTFMEQLLGNVGRFSAPAGGIGGSRGP